MCLWGGTLSALSLPTVCTSAVTVGFCEPSNTLRERDERSQRVRGVTPFPGSLGTRRFLTQETRDVIPARSSAGPRAALGGRRNLGDLEGSCPPRASDCCPSPSGGSQQPLFRTSQEREPSPRGPRAIGSEPPRPRLASEGNRLGVLGGDRLFPGAQPPHGLPSSRSP